jgi:hypothetical protein
MRYTNQYRNDNWLYAVYGNDRKDDYILIAVCPGVAWIDMAIRLHPDELALLRRSEEAFTEFVKEVTAKRDCSPWRERRIESHIVRESVEEIEVESFQGSPKATGKPWWKFW